MNIPPDTLTWLTVLTRWLGESGILARTAQHLGLALLIMTLATLTTLPLGTWIGHMDKGRQLVSATDAAWVVPMLGVPTLAGPWLDTGLTVPTLVLLILVVPPLLSMTYLEVVSTPRATADAARMIGPTESWVLAQAEAPHTAGLAATGAHSATLQVITTATLAAYTANYGLGRFPYEGLKIHDYAEMTGGVIIVVTLALMTNAPLALITRRLCTRTHSYSDNGSNSLRESL